MRNMDGWEYVYSTACLDQRLTGDVYRAPDDDDEECPELAESNSDDDGNGPVRARLNPITNT